jgi:hypothetical protein
MAHGMQTAVDAEHMWVRLCHVRLGKIMVC